MKISKKGLILLAVGCLILAMMVGGIVAREQDESHTVYNLTPTYSVTFTSHSQQTWMWFITIHETGYACLEIIENGQIIFEVSRNVTDQGNVNVPIRDGHTYTLVTLAGTEQIPGQATCTISTTSGGGDKPHP